MRGFQTWSQNDIWNRMTFTPLFGKKNGQNLANYTFCQFLTVFWPKMRSNVIKFQFWDQTWNPFIKAHLLGPKMNGMLIDYLLTQNCNFKTLVARGRVGMKILEKRNIPMCFHSPRPPRGSDPTPQPRFFVNKVCGVTGIDAKLGIPLRTSIWRLSAKFWKNFSKNFLEYTDLSDPSSCHFWSKMDKCLQNHQK